RPEINPDIAYLPILLGILLGTALFFLLVKYKTYRLWKFWYGLGITLGLLFAFKPFMDEWIAVAFAASIAFIRIFWKQVFIHNLSELFLYGGIAAIFVPILNLFSAVILLVLISAYDMYAVWKSKHMIAMAKEQSRQKLFAGLYLPYRPTQATVFTSIPTQAKGSTEGKEKNKVKSSASQHSGLQSSLKSTWKARIAALFRFSQQKRNSSTYEALSSPYSAKQASHTSSKLYSSSAHSLTEPNQTRTAILGGGDLAFPLLFAGVVMVMHLYAGILPLIAFFSGAIIAAAAAFALLLLLLFAKEETFYPAMPFLTLGCGLGYGLQYLFIAFVA
ncbi:MAG: presenilin family intramembrane aspartyl protease, partial [Candidatus Woesearchaeota archaeon]